MRPVTSQSLFMIISDKFTEGYGAGSYRAFMVLFIGLGLLVIGLLSIFIIFSGQTSEGPDPGALKKPVTTIKAT